MNCTNLMQIRFKIVELIGFWNKNWLDKFMKLKIIIIANSSTFVFFQYKTYVMFITSVYNLRILSFFDSKSKSEKSTYTEINVFKTWWQIIFFVFILAQYFFVSNVLQELFYYYFFLYTKMCYCNYYSI